MAPTAWVRTLFWTWFVFGRQAADTTAELVKPNSPPVKLPAMAGEASIARMDKMRNAKGHIPTAELRRELQVCTQKYDPVHRNADDLPKCKDVMVVIRKEYKDLGIRDSSNSWNTDLIETVKLDEVINQVVQAGGQFQAQLRDAEAELGGPDGVPVDGRCRKRVPRGRLSSTSHLGFPDVPLDSFPCPGTPFGNAITSDCQTLFGGLR